jgi:hypothetical protein
MDERDLKRFIVKAKRSTYAAGVSGVPAPRAGAQDLAYEEGDFRYLDSYYGGLQFLGQETVWYQGVPSWGMNYWGETIDAALAAVSSRSGQADLQSSEERGVPLFEMGVFLKEALLAIGEEAPFRGPWELKRRFGSSEAAYHCHWAGDMSGFTGEETIAVDNRAIFRLFFHGGLILR